MNRDEFFAKGSEGYMFLAQLNGLIRRNLLIEPKEAMKDEYWEEFVRELGEFSNGFKENETLGKYAKKIALALADATEGIHNEHRRIYRNEQK